VRCEQLRTQGISIERCERDRLPIRRLDTGAEINVEKESGCVIVARVDGRAVGWTFEILVFEDEGRKLSMVGPEVIPSYRHRGIGKVVHHLGTEEAVRRGAQGGWTATGLQNPARFIYRSVGYQYWYTAYSDLSRRVR
jgi:GNAT superfamily N-acetyltransferase